MPSLYIIYILFYSILEIKVFWEGHAPQNVKKKVCHFELFRNDVVKLVTLANQVFLEYFPFLEDFAGMSRSKF